MRLLKTGNGLLLELSQEGQEVLTYAERHGQKVKVYLTLDLCPDGDCTGVDMLPTFVTMTWDFMETNSSHCGMDAHPERNT